MKKTLVQNEKPNSRRFGQNANGHQRTPQRSKARSGLESFASRNGEAFDRAQIPTERYLLKRFWQDPVSGKRNVNPCIPVNLQLSARTWSQVIPVMLNYGLPIEEALTKLVERYVPSSGYKERAEPQSIAFYHRQPTGPTWAEKQMDRGKLCATLSKKRLAGYSKGWLLRQLRAVIK